MAECINSDRQWTYQMYKKLMDEYPLRGRSMSSDFRVSGDVVDKKADAMGVSVATTYTPEEEELFRKYGLKLKDAMLFLMPYRTPTEIRLHR